MSPKRRKQLVKRHASTQPGTDLNPDGNGEVAAEVLLGLDGQRQRFAEPDHDAVFQGLLFRQPEVIWIRKFDPVHLLDM